MLSLHLRAPHHSAVGDDTVRPVVLVRLISDDGEGWGECAALRSPTYAPEHAAGAWAVLRTELVPRLLDAPGRGLLGPADVASALGGVAGHHMAKAALEMAVLDAGLRRHGRSFASYLGVDATAVPGGAVVGLAPSPHVLVERVEELVEQGYGRVKVKIAPGTDREPLAALCARFPHLALQADANRSYGALGVDGAAAALAPLDELGLVCLDQPLDADDLVGHAALAQRLRTPVCLDESLTSMGRLEAAIALGACSVACCKSGPLGGLLEARRAQERCRAAGLRAWVGGMLETGLGRAANAALAGLPGFTLVGDVGGGRRFVEDDPFGMVALVDGMVPVHRGAGVAPPPDLSALDAVTTRFERLP